MKTLIIGGVAGGATAAARLRRLDEHAEIIILERGEYVSFANCGLPYYIGGVITEESALTLQTPQSFKNRFNVEVRVFNEAISIDPDANTVTVKDLRSGETYTESYDNLVVSPGAAPVIPNIEGLDSAKVFTLRNIPDTFRIKRYIEKEHPATAAVIGGGYIGAEMAENLAEAGLKVSVIELSDHLIAPLDGDMAADVHRYVRSKGIDLYLNNGVTAVRGNTLVLQKGEVTADLIILSVGVKPETEIAKACGIKNNKQGSIIVNNRMQTNIPNIYAVGDAVETEEFITKKRAFIPLAGPANKQGRIAADNIAGYDSVYTGTQGSAVLKLFDMTVATTGLNEKNAADAGIDYDKTYIFSAPHATYYPGGTNMSIKVLWDKNTHKLLGAQIVGFDGVDKRLDVFATAIRLGAKVTDLTTLELCYAPPFGSAKDPVNMIGFVAENTVSGKQKQFFWHDVDSLPRDGSVVLLDTRTPAEFQRSNIEGFVNIPLDSLRQRLAEIPTGKPVYVHCHSGHRSYVACRILSAHGFDCYNLAGGWRLYDSILEDRKNNKPIGKTDMNFTEIACNRQSCRAYDSSREVEREKLDSIISSARLSPSACNSQPYHITVCRGESAKKVAKATQGMGMNKFASDAPVLLVISEEPYNATAALGAKVKKTDYRSIDIGILSAYITAEATAQGLSTCILGWLDDAEIRTVCGLAGTVRLVITLGYAKAEDKLRPKKRKDTENLVTFLD